MTQAQTAGWYWQEYWTTPIPGSSGVSAQAAAADTRPVWEDWFAGLADGTTVIDLCTGGGALPRLAQAIASSQGKRLYMTGVDYALTAGSGNPDLADTCIMGSVNIEAMPFSDASFDAAVSQYGIEYADHERSLRELARIVRPGGCVRLLMHHSESAITQQAQRQVAAYDAVMADGLALNAARLAFETRKIDTSSPAALQSGGQFLKSILTVAGRTRHDPAYATVKLQLTYLNDLAMNVDRFDPESALQRLSDFDLRNTAWRMRQTCQIACALDPKTLNTFSKTAEQSGLNVLASTVQKDASGAVIGWCMDLTRLA